MGWSKKYKRSIDCNNPKGFSQKAHCAGRKKRENVMSSKLEELVGKPITEEQFDEAAGKKDACYHKVKARYDVWPSAYASGALVKCRKVGAANWGNKSKKEGVNEAPQKYRVYVKQKAHVGGPASKKFSVEKFLTGGMYFDYKKGMDTIKKLRKMNSTLDYKLVKEGVNETTKMKPQVKKLLKQKGYSPIFQAIDTSKRQFKQMRYSRGEIQDTLIDMFGDEDPKILQKIREGLGDRMAKKLKKHKGVNLKKKKIKLKGRGVYQDYDGLKEDVFFESTTENGMTTNHVYYEIDGKGYGYTLEFANDLNEAEYQGRKVKLGKIMQGDVKKFKVYVKNPKGNVVKVNFGQGGDAKGGTMRIRKSNPKARANFRARHNCDNPGPRHKARYWSCRKW